MKKYESLHNRLRGPIAEALKKELKIANVHALPKITKVTVNVGINRSKMESKEMQEYIAQCLAKMTGQKAVFTRSRKAISNFKIRQGLIVGAVVTLHGRRMEEFLDRLLSYVLPRIRDFRGITPKLDGHGNYAIGLKDHSIFPEVPPPDAGRIFGVQIQLTTNARTDEPARALFKAMGVPFRPSRSGGKAASSPSS
ncbi:MAG: 50S ribosomal protein L5 [Candidatus Peribacteraceae bacterium]|nr:50S ribosomal protein L5 [Candidatus Peribacteraceae bacterium]